MTELLVHDATRRAFDDFLSHPAHAVLLAGPAGIGKASLAGELALRLVGSVRQTAVDEPSILLIQPDNNSIGIESVRQLQHFFSLKAQSSRPISRVAVIEDAHKLTLDAQNTLLKLLEEPPADSVVILTATSGQAVLPTIMSRVQLLTVDRPPKEAVLDYFAGNSAPDQIERIFNMSGGLPGLMSSLLNDTESHPLRLAADTARQLIQKTAFERLCQIDVLTKDRQLAIDTCAMLGQMAELALKNPKTPPAQAKRWQFILSGALQAGDDLGRYVQPKLVLTRYFLSF